MLLLSALPSSSLVGVYSHDLTFSFHTLLERSLSVCSEWAELRFESGLSLCGSQRLVKAVREPACRRHRSHLGEVRAGLKHASGGPQKRLHTFPFEEWSGILASRTTPPCLPGARLTLKKGQWTAGCQGVGQEATECLTVWCLGRCNVR